MHNVAIVVARQARAPYSHVSARVFKELDGKIVEFGITCQIGGHTLEPYAWKVGLVCNTYDLLSLSSLKATSAFLGKVERAYEKSSQKIRDAAEAAGGYHSLAYENYLLNYLQCFQVEKAYVSPYVNFREFNYESEFNVFHLKKSRNQSIELLESIKSIISQAQKASA